MLGRSPTLHANRPVQQHWPLDLQAPLFMQLAKQLALRCCEVSLTLGANMIKLSPLRKAISSSSVRHISIVAKEAKDSFAAKRDSYSVKTSDDDNSEYHGRCADGSSSIGAVDLPPASRSAKIDAQHGKGTEAIEKNVREDQQVDLLPALRPRAHRFPGRFDLERAAAGL
ncbi:hypothetical protein NLG97_g6598 [Lecanicillium saksenae]|uniref:Uncharacterized protein n=1 Tax=Lecanicillium saksenae TaxID=468837 RepID=A0ACC1QSC6_9HYPO|nr:hypothetical protein NLG97_g6598 [Lecanicillium saksenae]